MGKMYTHSIQILAIVRDGLTNTPLASYLKRGRMRAVTSKRVQFVTALCK